MTREWRVDAVCRQVDPELFFPVARPGTAPYDVQVGQAKLVCARCPVREACLADALVGVPHGVAGGLSAEERAGLRREAAGGFSWFGEADPVMVDRLVATGRVAGATRLELSEAAVVLVRSGWPANRAANHLRVRLSSVLGWVTNAEQITHACEAIDRDEGRGVA